MSILFPKAFGLVAVALTSVGGPLWEKTIGTGTDKNFFTVWAQASACIDRVTDFHGFPAANPLECMRSESSDPDVAPFNGIWWMDGNPAVEELASFAEAYVDDDGYLWLPIRPVDGGTWAYKGGGYHLALFNMVAQCAMEVVTGFVRTEDGTELLASYNAINSAAESYEQLDIHTYRKTFSHGLVYHLRRIIGPDNQPTHNFANYTAYLQEEDFDTMYTYKSGGCTPLT